MKNLTIFLLIPVLIAVGSCVPKYYLNPSYNGNREVPPPTLAIGPAIGDHSAVTDSVFVKAFSMKPFDEFVTTPQVVQTRLKKKPAVYAAYETLARHEYADRQLKANDGVYPLPPGIDLDGLRAALVGSELLLLRRHDFTASMGTGKVLVKYRVIDLMSGQLIYERVTSGYVNGNDPEQVKGILRQVSGEAWSDCDWKLNLVLRYLEYL